MRRTPWVLPFLFVVACGGPDGIEEGPVDARGPDYTFVVSDTEIPMTAAAAAMMALDVDTIPGDGSDNELGRVMEAVNALAAGIDIEATLDARFARGEILMLVNLKANDLANANGVGFVVYQGANPIPAPCVNDADDVCRRHLTGQATFEATRLEDNTIAGRIINGAYTGGPGRLTVRLGELTLPMQETKIELRSVTSETLGTSKIVGAIAAADLDNVVIPGLAALVRVSAPAVTDEQVAAAVHSVALDIDLDEDGTKDALSIGFGIGAVPGWFTPVR